MCPASHVVYTPRNENFTKSNLLLVAILGKSSPPINVFDKLGVEENVFFLFKMPVKSCGCTSNSAAPKPFLGVVEIQVMRRGALVPNSLRSQPSIMPTRLTERLRTQVLHIK